MKATAKRIALGLGVLILTASCNNVSTTESGENITELAISNPLETIKIDGSSTVYPIRH